MHIGTRPPAATVDRAIDILETLRDSPDPLGVRDISRRVGISPASAHRFLATLRQRGLVVQPDGARTYTLGWALLDYANAVLQGVDLASVAAPIARTLRDLTGETVTVQVPVGSDRVCVFEQEGTHEVRRRVGVGRRVPLHAGASGHAILAFMSQADIDRVLETAASARLTPRTVTDPRRLRKLLDAVRESGVAFSSGESVEGVASMAAPVFGASGSVAGSIAVSGPASRWTVPAMRGHAQDLRAAADDISRRLGYRGADPTVLGGPGGEVG